MSSVPNERNLLPLPALFASPAKRSVVFSLCLVLGTVLIYARVLQNSFINVDDPQYVTQNPEVVSGLHWETVKWAFGTTYAGNWHPLTWLSHALDCQMVGLNPVGHHFIGVLLHSVNAALLFLVLQSITGFAWRSLMVAALFAVHPLNVESVAWAAERKNLLSMFFFLLALWAYTWYVRKPVMARYLAIVGLFALALMAKPQVITFPLVLLLTDYWPLGRIECADPSAANSTEAHPARFGWLMVEKVPLLLLSALSAFITVDAQSDGHAVRSTVEYPVLARIENAIVSYCRYLGDAFLPRHLAAMYPHPGDSLEIWKVVVCGIAILAISALVIVGRRRRYLAVGWLWFLGTLVPMIGLVQVGMQARADRYIYISMIGIFVLTVWGLADLTLRLKIRPVLLFVIWGIVLVGLSAATYNQIGYWRNSETLWTHALSVTERNFMAEADLAQDLAHQGRTTEALVHFHKTLTLYDWGAPDLITFGIYEQRQGYAADAVAQFQRALHHTTDASLRTIAFSKMGSAYLDLKNEDRARQSFEEVLQVDANNPSALIGVGLVAHRHGDLNLAIHQYAKAVSRAPNDVGFFLLGKALEQSGRSIEAQVAYQQAQRLTSNFGNTRSVAERWLSR
jgi:Flp pilus assembly protein TadD